MKVPIAMPAVAPEERPPLSDDAADEDDDGEAVDDVAFEGVVGVEEEVLGELPVEPVEEELGVLAEEFEGGDELVPVLVVGESLGFSGALVVVNMPAIASKWMTIRPLRK